MCVCVCVCVYHLGCSCSSRYVDTYVLTCMCSECFRTHNRLYTVFSTNSSLVTRSSLFQLKLYRSVKQTTKADAWFSVAWQFLMLQWIANSWVEHIYMSSLTPTHIIIHYYIIVHVNVWTDLGCLSLHSNGIMRLFCIAFCEWVEGRNQLARCLL